MNQKYAFGVKVMFLNLFISFQVFGQDRNPIFENDYNIRPISEINEKGFGDAYPWISNDGLRLYYTAQNVDDEKSDIWVARRPDLYSSFEDIKSLSIYDDRYDNLSSWLTDDELTIAFIKRRRFGQKMTALYISHRQSTSEDFNTPQIIKLDKTIKGTLISPSFTQDLSELIIYNEYKKDKFLLTFERVGDYEYKLKGTINIPDNYTIKTGKLSSDGLSFYVSLEYKNRNPKLYVLTRDHAHKNFGEMHLLKSKVLNPTNERNHQPYFSSDGQFVVFTRSVVNEWHYNEIFIGQVEDIAHHKNEIVKENTQEAFLYDVSIYPNPSSAFVSISNPGARAIKVNIFNAQGQLVNEVKQNIDDHYIDISAYTAGSYIFKILDLDSQQQRTFKVIKVD